MHDIQVMILMLFAVQYGAELLGVPVRVPARLNSKSSESSQTDMKTLSSGKHVKLCLQL